MIRVDEENSDVLVVDTLSDIFELLARNEIWVRVSDKPSCPRNSKLRDLDIEESLCGIELEKLEWLHSQISELKEDEEVDLETMQSYIEDLREPYLKEET